jgi:Tfp pilus assembly protein PilO
MSITTKIILALIALHLVIGFGWMIYKLSPKKKSGEQSDNDEEER